MIVNGRHRRRLREVPIPELQQGEAQGK